MKQSVAVAILCIIVGVQALTNEQKLILLHSDKCVAEANDDSGIMKQARSEDLTPNPQFLRYVFCLLTATRVLNENGDPQPENIKETLRSDYTVDEIDDLLAKCRPHASTPLEKAGEFWKCYWENCKRPITFS